MAKYQFQKVQVYTEITQEAFNKHLAYIKSAGINIINGLYDRNLDKRTHSGIYTAYLYQGKSWLKLTYKKGKNQEDWVSICTNLAQDYNKDFKEGTQIKGAEAYRYFRRFVEIEDFVPEDLAFNPCLPFQYKNDNYIGKRIDNCIGYDLNKAYLSFCKDLKGPIKFLRYNSYPNEGEVGYDAAGNMLIGPSDHMCVYIFTYGLIPGINNWVTKLADKINTTEDPKYKQYANYAIGYLVYHHPILRHTIMLKAESTMKGLIDSNTLYSNTDSLVSMVERPDLTISDQVGDFKIEHQGSFIFYSQGKYQWNTGMQNISAKGVSKGKLINYCKQKGKSLEDYKLEDITEDLERAENPWKFNRSTLKIYRNTFSRSENYDASR